MCFSPPFSLDSIARPDSRALHAMTRKRCANMGSSAQPNSSPTSRSDNHVISMLVDGNSVDAIWPAATRPNAIDLPQIQPYQSKEHLYRCTIDSPSLQRVG